MENPARFLLTPCLCGRTLKENPILPVILPPTSP